MGPRRYISAAAAVTLARPRLWPCTLGAWCSTICCSPRRDCGRAAIGWVRTGPLCRRSSAARGEIAITIDDGPDPEVTPRCSRCSRLQAPAPAFSAWASGCCAIRSWRGRSCAAATAIENHSQRHRHDFSLLGPRRMAAEIAQAQESIARVTGETPRFFRAPAGLRNPFLEPVLVPPAIAARELDAPRLRYRQRRPRRCLPPLEPIARGRRHLAAARRPRGARATAGRPVILEVLPRLLETLRAGGNCGPSRLRAALS